MFQLTWCFLSRHVKVRVGSYSIRRGERPHCLKESLCHLCHAWIVEGFWGVARLVIVRISIGCRVRDHDRRESVEQKALMIRPVDAWNELRSGDGAHGHSGRASHGPLDGPQEPDGTEVAHDVDVFANVVE